jgi:glycogen debranching enzyme
VAADLNTYLAVQLDDLSRMAALLGREADAQRYRDEATSWVERMIAVLWNEDAGYFDFLYEGQRIPVLTPFSLLPLWTGRLPAAINARLVAHLTNPATFWTEYAVPTVALNDPDFDAKQMWRGPTWPNINLLFVEGLEKIGERALASELRRKTLRMMQRHRDIYEYYDPLTAERPPKAAPIFGWSSATFVELAIQESAHRG